MEKEEMSKIIIPEETIINQNLKGYSALSAYCNGANFLYISGGESPNSDEGLDDFWEIDIKKEQVYKAEEPMKYKKRHSMIYIPKKYVFVIGGNNKQTFYFDTNHKTFINWADLNNKRIKPE